jgi:hypothetical protein
MLVIEARRNRSGNSFFMRVVMAVWDMGRQGKGIGACPSVIDPMILQQVSALSS